MKKTLLAILCLTLLTTSVTAALMAEYVSPLKAERRLGVERITHYDPRVAQGRTKNFVYLTAVTEYTGRGVGRGGYDPILPRGTADVRTVNYFGYPRSNVVIKVKDLPPTEETGLIYEAWMVDVDSGYRLSLGTFTTLKGGVGRLIYNAQVSMGVYDSIEVTAEPVYDVDLAPGPLMLAASLPPNNPIGKVFNPPPAQKRNAQSYLSS